MIKHNDKSSEDQPQQRQPPRYNVCKHCHCHEHRCVCARCPSCGTIAGYVNAPEAEYCNQCGHSVSYM